MCGAGALRRSDGAGVAIPWPPPAAPARRSGACTQPFAAARVLMRVGSGMGRDPPSGRHSPLPACRARTASPNARPQNQTRLEAAPRLPLQDGHDCIGRDGCENPYKNHLEDRGVVLGILTYAGPCAGGIAVGGSASVRIVPCQLLARIAALNFSHGRSAHSESNSCDYRTDCQPYDLEHGCEPCRLVYKSSCGAKKMCWHGDAAGYVDGAIFGYRERPGESSTLGARGA